MSTSAKEDLKAAVAVGDWEKAAENIAVILSDQTLQNDKQAFSLIKDYTAKLAGIKPETLQTLIAALRKMELDAEQLIVFADLLIQTRDLKGAETNYRKAIEKEPENLAGYEQLATLYGEPPAQYDKAVECLLKCVAIELRSATKDNEYIAGKYSEAGTLYMEEIEDAKKALECYQNALTHNAALYQNYYYCGLALKDLEQYQDATATIKIYLEKTTDKKERGEGLYMLGELYDLLHRPVQAAQYFIEALAYDETMVYAYHNLASIFRMNGEFRKSADNAQQAFKYYADEYKQGKFKEEPAKYYYYAELIREYKNVKSKADYNTWKELITAYVKVQPLDPDGAMEMFTMYLYRNKAIAEKKLVSYEDPAKQLMEEEEVHSSMMQWYRVAVERMEEAIKNIPDALKIKYYCTRLGQLYLSFDMFEEAKENFKKALSVDTSMEKAADGMGVACFRTGDYAQAIKHFKTAAIINPSSLSIACNLADSFRCSGDIEEAERTYM